MRTISRRRALLVGGVGVAATTAGGAGVIWALTFPPGPVTGAKLVQPLDQRSVDGQLQLRLAAGPRPLFSRGPGHHFGRPGEPPGGPAGGKDDGPRG